MLGPWEALTSAVGDTLWEVVSGRVMTRVNASEPVGSTVIVVEGTDRFPAAGNFTLNGVVYAYTGKTATLFTGVAERLSPTTVSGTTGLVAAASPQDVIVDESMSETQLDKLRRSFLILYAEDEDLDTLGENYGVPRPRGIDDDTYRSVLRVLIATEAGTMYALEKLLDALYGGGNYTLYEDMARFPRKVFLDLPADAVSATGRSFVAGGYDTTRATTTTVVTRNTQDALIAYGVYADTDRSRSGTNYALETDASGSVASANPSRVTAALSFVSGDVGTGIQVTVNSVAQHWRVSSIISGTEVEAAWPDQSDGRATASGNTLTTTTPWFAEWVAAGAPTGTQIVVTGGANAGTYDVTARPTVYSVTVTPAFPATETDMTWRLIPNYSSNLAASVSIPRATISGSTITTPVTMPADVLVDYTTVESAQVIADATVDGNAQSAFYLFGIGSAVKTVVDIITAAGVEAIFGSE